MKLIGSKTEREIRAELQKSNAYFRSPSRLKDALEFQGHSTTNAFVLHWTPEQSEDIYVVLVDGAYLIKVELDRAAPNSTPIYERIELTDYKHRLSRVNLIQLLVAQDLANAKT